MTTTHEAPAPGAIRSLIPARIDRLPWSPFHTRMVVALGVAWILDGLEITVASAVVALLTKQETLGLSSTAGGSHRHGLPGRRGRRRAVLRVAVGQAGPQEAVHHHAGRLPGRQRADRAHAQQRHRLAGLPVRHPVHRRHGHRRRVRGDQLRDRRADPGPVPRPRRHHGQRHLLGRRHHRHAGHATSSSTSCRPNIGWRVAFLLGPVLGLVIIFVRRHLPESPRWQVMHGHEAEAEETIDYIEHEVEQRRPRRCRRCPRTRRSRSSRPRTSATSRWPGCCSRSTRSGRSTAPR